MDVVTTIIVILLCLGAVQGLVFGLILWRSKGGNRTANQILAIILFFLSYRLTVQILRLFGLGYYDTWYHLMIDFNWIYGPLIYFFVKAQLDPSFRLQRKDWVHFIPVGIQFICSNFVRAQNFYWDGTRDSLSWLGYYGYVVWMNYPTIYIIASLLIVIYSFKAEKLIKNPPAKIDLVGEKVVWIRRVILAFRVYFLFVITILLMDLFWYEISIERWYYYFERFYYYPLFIGVAILTYWLGIVGFNRRDEQPLKTKPILSAKEEQQLDALAKRLVQLMKEEKVYKDAGLSLSALAAQLEVKPYLLSKCLKFKFDTKFHDYINGLRVEEVKRMLATPHNQHYTLLAIAYEAGFNSKASFNRAVKKQLGISPSELKNNIGQSHPFNI